MDRTLIARYREGAEALASGIAGLSHERLLAHPVPGTWSIQEIVLHMADSDQIGAERMKRTIAEERPTLVAFDESAFARRLHYQEQDAHQAAELFRLNRLMLAAVLERLTDDDFARVGIHSERGPVTLAEQLETHTEHLEHHLKFLHEKRGMVQAAP
ncbi:MAG: DinB family protein [Pirellulales bacterium]|nr:DinB family protein [Pirellulales bacterium]